MSTGKIKTLYSDKEKTEALFPRTKTSAISDANGKGLDAILDEIDYKIIEAAGGNSGQGGTTLPALGITATATELNYCDGVTSNIQTQLNGKQMKIEYGDTLPTAGTVGRIFFKKVSV